MEITSAHLKILNATYWAPKLPEAKPQIKILNATFWELKRRGGLE